jgi:hypothetical protein
LGQLDDIANPEAVSADESAAEVRRRVRMALDAFLKPLEERRAAVAAEESRDA